MAHMDLMTDQTEDLRMDLMELIAIYMDQIVDPQLELMDRTDLMDQMIPMVRTDP